MLCRRRVAGGLDLDPVAQRAAAQHPAARRDARRGRPRSTGSPSRMSRDGRCTTTAVARSGPIAGPPAKATSRRRRRSRAPRPTTRPAGSRCPSCARRTPWRRPATSCSPSSTKPSARARRTRGRQYWRMNGAQPAGPVPCQGPRPADDVVQVGVHARARHHHAQPLGLAGERGPDPHAGRVGDRAVEDRRPPGVARPRRDSGQRPTRADAAEHDRGPPVGPGEPPEPAARG